MKHLRSSSFASVLVLVLVLGCEAESTSAGTTGGVDTPGSGDCPTGVVAVLSDYTSTQIALADLEGKTLSESFISTGSTQASGLAFALSGDVSVPSSIPASGRVVLLDRYGTNVVSFVDRKTAEVVAQLPVGTGFESNPRDYLEVDETRALVTRWGENEAAGQQPMDAGGDVLVIDAQRPAILERIAMPTHDALPPRPSGMLRIGGDVVVVLQRLSLDFAMQGDGVLVSVSIADEAIAWEFPIAGLKGCGTPELAPDGKRMALACAGQLDVNGDVVDLGKSGIALFDLATTPFAELERFAAADLAGEAIQSDVEFASNRLLLFKTQTKLGGSKNNRALVLDLETRTSTELAKAAPEDDGTGKGIVYGSYFCVPGCSDICLMADADRGLLQRWRVLDGTLEALDAVRVEERVGLPPQSLGGFR